MVQISNLILLSILFISGDAIPFRLLKNLKLGKLFNARIIGGEETTIENNPWQVSIQLLGVLHSCGGSIISPDTVVTAAHCVDSLTTPFLYNVKAGTADLSSPGVTVSIQSAIVNEQYNYLDYDIAILKLAENLTFSDEIQAIKLPEEKLEAGDKVKVSGWGVTSEGGIFTPNVLREVNVTIIDRTECQTRYIEYDQVTERMICAGAEGGGKDACQGDSGGPLSKDGVLEGIVSWGVGCAQAEYPGVYTNVHSLRSWIKEKTGL